MNYMNSLMIILYLHENLKLVIICCQIVIVTNEYGIKIGGINKLVPHLGDKNNYVFNYKNLQLYLSLGIKLPKFQRILKFKESDYLKKYMDFNTSKINNADNNFGKRFF